RPGLSDSGKRQELAIRGIRQTLEQRDLADHLAVLRRKITDHAQSGGTAQLTSGGSSYVSIIPYVAADANTRTNLGLNNFSQSSLTHGPSPITNVVIGLLDAQGTVSGS